MKGKSVCVVNDLTIDEQRFLYATAARLKSEITSGVLPVPDTNGSTYLMFLEDSTRTKESFRNASETLSFRTNMFDSGNSSINKFETINDTVRMLCGYTPSLESVFVIRSKIEGLCKSLSESMAVYAEKAGLGRPIFVNAGDGRHEHPTQEFLDEFSFLEQLNNDTSRIHIALVGDLLLGRTIHSKVDGLRIFTKVVVDLVAPDELQLPATYLEKMKKNGFEINSFSSLDEYLSRPKQVASILYFTRLQLERMSPSVLERISEMRKATSLTTEMLSSLPTRAKIYHPLPRHGEFPEIPFAVDHSRFNGYDEQSRNGYFVRTALLGLLTGAIESPIATLEKKPTEHNLITTAFASPSSKDHPLQKSNVTLAEMALPAGTQIKDMRKLVSRFQKLVGLDNSAGFCEATEDKVIFSFPSEAREHSLTFFPSFTAFFAHCEPRLIIRISGSYSAVTATFQPGTRLVLPGMCCPNSACVANPNMKQRDVVAAFELSKISLGKFTCIFCETEVCGHEMWP